MRNLLLVLSLLTLMLGAVGCPVGIQGEVPAMLPTPYGNPSEWHGITPACASCEALVMGDSHSPAWTALDQDGASLDNQQYLLVGCYDGTFIDGAMVISNARTPDATTVVRHKAYVRHHIEGFTLGTGNCYAMAVLHDGGVAEQESLGMPLVHSFLLRSANIMDDITWTLWQSDPPR